MVIHVMNLIIVSMMMFYPYTCLQMAADLQISHWLNIIVMSTKMANNSLNCARARGCASWMDVFLAIALVIIPVFQKKNSNPSTIDYFLCSPEILDTSRFLPIEAPSRDSIHCLLTLSISTKVFSTISIPNENLDMEDISNYSFSQRFEEVAARHAKTFDVPVIPLPIQSMIS